MRKALASLPLFSKAEDLMVAADYFRLSPVIHWKEGNPRNPRARSFRAAFPMEDHRHFGAFGDGQNEARGGLTCRTVAMPFS